MHIEGDFQAFRAWVSDDPKREADTLLYKTGALGKVTQVVFPRESVEWVFPASEVVTFNMLRTVIRSFIHVIDWTL